MRGTGCRWCGDARGHGAGRTGGPVLLPEQRLAGHPVLADRDRGRREKEEFLGRPRTSARTDVLFAFANVTYRSGVRVSSRLVRRPRRTSPGQSRRWSVRR